MSDYTVLSAGVICEWDPTLGDGGACFPDLTQFSAADASAGSGPFLQVITCQGEQAFGTDDSLTGCEVGALVANQ